MERRHIDTRKRRKAHLVSATVLDFMGPTFRLMHRVAPSDGKFLRDFSFTYDPVGHLPVRTLAVIILGLFTHGGDPAELAQCLVLAAKLLPQRRGKLRIKSSDLSVQIYASSSGVPAERRRCHIDLCLHSYLDEVRRTLGLHEDKVRISSPQGHYLVKRFVFRAQIDIRPLTIVSTAAAPGGMGPGGLDVVHDEWVGKVVLEIEGTKEYADFLVSK